MECRDDCPHILHSRSKITPLQPSGDADERDEVFTRNLFLSCRDSDPRDLADAHNMARKNGYIVQQPGPKNSLGLVKFDMQNDHAIYLHDTPATALSALVQRQRSHGCVRVADALGFAEILARDANVLDEWHQARKTGKESFVKLPHQIPVRMLYQTVLFDDTGEPIVRNDPYGWDDRVGAALGFKVGKALRVRTDQADFGP